MASVPVCSACPAAASALCAAGAGIAGSAPPVQRPLLQVRHLPALDQLVHADAQDLSSTAQHRRARCQMTACHEQQHGVNGSLRRHTYKTHAYVNTHASDVRGKVALTSMVQPQATPTFEFSSLAIHTPTTVRVSLGLVAPASTRAPGRVTCAQ
jgi:hypothetical protein